MVGLPKGIIPISSIIGVWAIRCNMEWSIVPKKSRMATEEHNGTY